MSLPKQQKSAVASLISVKLYLLHVPLPLRWDSNPRFVSKTHILRGKTVLCIKKSCSVSRPVALY